MALVHILAKSTTFVCQLLPSKIFPGGKKCGKKVEKINVVAAVFYRRATVWPPKRRCWWNTAWAAAAGMYQRTEALKVRGGHFDVTYTVCLEIMMQMVVLFWLEHFMDSFFWNGLRILPILTTCNIRWWCFIFRYRRTITNFAKWYLKNRVICRFIPWSHTSFQYGLEKCQCIRTSPSVVVNMHVWM